MILKAWADALVLDKPAGVSTHTPDAGNTEGFLEMASRILNQPLWAVHRLDRDTSGCLIVTTKPESVEAWSAKLQRGNKKYTFISPKKSKKSVWSVSGRIEKVASHQFGLVPGEPNSHTTFALLGPCGLGYLYEAEITTGKTHQIRIHAAHSEIPILGDNEHGGAPFTRLMLHAKDIALDDDKVSSPLPKLFTQEGTVDNDTKKFLVSLDRRRFLINYQQTETDCFRLVHREWTMGHDPKLCIEKLGDVIQFLNYGEGPLPKPLIDGVLAHVPHKYWFVRHMKDRGLTPEETTNVSQVCPDMPLQWVVKENKIKFDLRHGHGQSSGLFLDQRENRKRVMQRADSKRVANFFSYTCGFSVAAALGGANEVVSIDTSQAALNWGKDNFTLNNLNPEKFEFFVADSIFFLKSCTKRGRLFDMIIIDPPTFSRHKHGIFKIKENLNELLDLSFKSLAKDGCLLVTLNDEGIPSSQLAQFIEDSVHRVGRGPAKLERIRPPYDFEFPLERQTVLKGFWVEV